MSDCFAEHTSTIRDSTTVPRHAGCYGYTFINKGDTGVRVNQTYLKPYPPGRPDLSGESYSFVDPLRSLFNDDFQIIFDAAPGATPILELHQYHKVL
jgi:hypothetical protein